MTSLITIEGIGQAYAQKLQQAGIETVEKLLDACATPQARDALSQATGIGSQTILDWANRADLFRVKGVGEEYSDLLEAAGVDTVSELAQRNPANLHQALLQTNRDRKVVRRAPTVAQVSAWVEHAKALPRKLHY